MELVFIFWNRIKKGTSNFFFFFFFFLSLSFSLPGISLRVQDIELVSHPQRVVSSFITFSYEEEEESELRIICWILCNVY